MSNAIQLLDSAGLAEKKRYPVVNRWHDYLATGMTTLLTGHGKAGKTTLLSLMLERLTSGRPLAGSPVGVQKAIVISEESAELWHSRVAALGIRDNVRWICSPFRSRPKPQDWMDLIGSVRMEPVQLIAIDTLGHFLPDDRENNADRLLQALMPLKILTGPGRSLLLMHHPKKDAPHKALTPRGSGALTAFVDIIFNLDLPRNAHITDRRRIFRCWSRLGGASERVFELSADGFDYLPVVEPIREDPFEAGWSVLQTVLEDYGNDLTRRDILAAWPEDHDAPSKMTLHRWLHQAYDLGRVQRSGTGRCNEPFRYGLAAAGNPGLIQP